MPDLSMPAVIALLKSGAVVRYSVFGMGQWRVGSGRYSRTVPPGVVREMESRALVERRKDGMGRTYLKLVEANR